MPNAKRIGGFCFAATIAAAAWPACATTPERHSISPAERAARWRVDDGDWFVEIILAHEATLVDAQRVILALRHGSYEDRTADAAASRTVIDSMASGVIVTFASYGDNTHSLAWPTRPSTGALVELSTADATIRLLSAGYFLDRTAGDRLMPTSRPP